MNEYMNSENKKEYFEVKSIDIQKEILFSLDDNQKKELLNEISVDSIKEILNEYRYGSDERKKILECLSKDKLKDVYRSLSEVEQKEIREEFERIQANLIFDIHRYENSINNSSRRIINSTDRIEQARSNIVDSKIRIREDKVQISDNEVVLKRVTREKEKLFKKISRIEARGTSRLGIVNKRRLNKLKELTAQYDNKRMSIDELRQKNMDLRNEIQRAKDIIISEKDYIRDSKNQIKADQKNIREKAKEIKGKKVTIKELDKTGKNVFGRKMYKKTVHLRDDMLIKRKRKIVEQKLAEKIVQEEVAIKNMEETTTKKTSEEKVQEEAIVKESDTKKSVQNLTDVLQVLLNSGLNMLPSVNLNSSDNQNLLNKPIDNITPEQLVMFVYSMNYAYNLGLQHQKNQQMKTVQSDDMYDGKIVDLNEYRNRSSRRAFVSFSVIIAMLVLTMLITMIMILLK